MLQVELKKILFHQKGLPILLLSLMAYAVVVLCGGYDSSYALDRNEAVYRAYMERWQGMVTEENARELEAEYHMVNRSGSGDKAAFQVVYNQYYYAKEDPAHRYLVDERGWNTLLTHDGLNLVLLLCLLALSVPVFCGEYQCGMDQILRSCRNGRNRLACMKLLTMMALAICAAVLFQLVQLLVLSTLTGLEGTSYPLQSLSFFEHSPYTLTIGQAYVLVFLCRCIGAAWFALLIALLSGLLRQVVVTAFAGIAMSVLPHLIGGGFIKYVLPLPAGLLAGTGYLWGALTETGYDENWNLTEIVTFRGITPMELGFLLAAFSLLIGVLFYAGLRCYVGKRNIRVPRSAAAVVLALLLVGSLTGCTPNSAKEVTHDFLSDAARGENTVYFITLDMLENNIYAADKESGETILLTRGPFALEKRISSIFVDENACYYAMQSDAEPGFEIYRIDLTDFSDRLYFSNSSEHTAAFWGLYQRDLTEDEILAGAGTVSSFMVDGGNLYVLQDSQLRQICRFTGHETVIASDVWNVQSLVYRNGEIKCEKNKEQPLLEEHP